LFPIRELGIRLRLGHLGLNAEQLLLEEANLFLADAVSFFLRDRLEGAEGLVDEEAVIGVLAAGVPGEDCSYLCIRVTRDVLRWFITETQIHRGDIMTTKTSSSTSRHSTTDTFRTALASHLSQLRNDCSFLERCAGTLYHAEIKEVPVITGDINEVTANMRRSMVVMQNAWRAYDDEMLETNPGKVVSDAQAELFHESYVS